MEVPYYQSVGQRAFEWVADKVDLAPLFPSSTVAIMFVLLLLMVLVSFGLVARAHGDDDG